MAVYWPFFPAKFYFSQTKPGVPDSSFFAFLLSLHTKAYNPKAPNFHQSV